MIMIYNDFMKWILIVLLSPDNKIIYKVYNKIKVHCEQYSLSGYSIIIQNAENPRKYLIQLLTSSTNRC